MKEQVACDIWEDVYWPAAGKGGKRSQWCKILRFLKVDEKKR